MADEGKSTTYPRIPAKNWWDLRQKLTQAVPRRISADYLQSVLGIKAGAANNLLAPLRLIGLIDDSEEPTKMATDWRSDTHYAEVCESLIDKLYPHELRDALPPPTPDRKAVIEWFMRNTGTGRPASTQMASFYLLLCQADAAGNDQRTKVKKESPKKAKLATKEPRRAPAPTTAPPVQHRTRGEVLPQVPATPSLHIDIQVHIAADAKPEQIDQVFASMAKHLYGK